MSIPQKALEMVASEKVLIKIFMATVVILITSIYVKLFLNSLDHWRVYREDKDKKTNLSFPEILYFNTTSLFSRGSYEILPKTDASRRLLLLIYVSAFVIIIS